MELATAAAAATTAATAAAEATTTATAAAAQRLKTRDDFCRAFEKTMIY